MAEPTAIDLTRRVAPDVAGFAQVMCDLATVVHGGMPLGERISWIVRACQETLGADFAAYAVMGDGAASILHIEGATPAQVGAVVDRQMREVVRQSLRAGGPPCTLDDALGAMPSRSAAWRSILRAPVVGASGDFHGGIVVGATAVDAFAGSDAIILQAIASHLGVALGNHATLTRLAELEASQREVVHQLQYAVHPDVPHVEHVELGVHYLAADPSAPTGGDLYDWQLLPDGDLHIAVVDVLGKGVAATKDAVAVTHALRLLVLDGCPLDRLIERADELVTSSSPELVATLTVCRYRPSTGSVRLVSGGHPPALHVTADGKVAELGGRGIPIGWPGAGSREVVEIELDRQDTLVLYTDGLIESTKDIIEGIDRLATAAGETARYPATHMARTLVERSLAGAARFDDSLALVVRRRVPPMANGAHVLGPFEHRFTPSPASVNLARHLLSDWLERQPIDGEDAQDLLVVAGELCANAMRAASGTPGSVALRARTEESAIVIEVEDDGSGFELDLTDGDLPDTDAESGRGLFLVNALTDGVELVRQRGHTVVRARRDCVLAAAT